MGKSSYSGKVATAALAALGYLSTASSAYAQNSQSQQNQKKVEGGKTIVSLNPCYTAAGNGISLVDYCPEIDVRADSKIDLKEKFGLASLLKGKNVKYSAVDLKNGAQIALVRLYSQVPFTARDTATAKYLVRLSREEKNDVPSVYALNNAVRDGVLEGSEVIGKIKEGKYALIAQDSLSSVITFPRISLNSERKRLDSVAAANEFARSAREKYVADSSAMAESAARAYREREAVLQDSVSKMKDSLANVKGATVDTSKKYFEFSVEKKAPQSETKTGKRFSLETSYGPNTQFSVGASAKALDNPNFSLGFYAQYNITRGNASEDSTSTITMRERQLIGPGTYKERVDQLIEKSREENVGEFGLELLLNPEGRFSFPIRIGLGLLENKETPYERSAISHTRNDSLLEPTSVIENSGKTTVSRRTGFGESVGIDYRITDNLSANLSLIQTANKKSGLSAGMKVRF